MFKSFGLVGSPALIRAVTAYYAEVEAEAEAKAEAEAEAECENCEVVYIA